MGPLDRTTWDDGEKSEPSPAPITFTPSEEFLEKAPDRLAKGSYVAGAGTVGCGYMAYTSIQSATLSASGLGGPIGWGIGTIVCVGFFLKYGRYPISQYLRLSPTPHASGGSSILEPSDFDPVRLRQLAAGLEDPRKPISEQLMLTMSRDFAGINMEMAHFTNLDRDSFLWEQLEQPIQELQMSLGSYQQKIAEQMERDLEGDALELATSTREVSFKPDPTPLIPLMETIDTLQRAIEAIYSEDLKVMSEVVELATHLSAIKTQLEALPWIDKNKWILWLREQLSDR